MASSPYTDKLDPYSSHSIIGKWLNSFAAGTRVLDVGTATGTIGRLCRDRGLILSGIEPVEQWAETARGLYQFFSGTVLSETNDEFIQGHQVVICADILEHTPDPSSELLRLVCLQPAGSAFFISVPNIANIWVRLNLFLGRFNYTDRGILDRTHLRFFTRSTITQMISNTGLKIEKIVPTPIPLHLVHPFFDQAVLGRWIYWLLNKMTQVVPTLLGYQFVVYAKKHSS